MLKIAHLFLRVPGRYPNLFHSIFRRRAIQTAVLACTIASSSLVAAAIPDPTNTQAREQLAPFFERHCVKCHSGAEPEGDLRLDELQFALTEPENRDLWSTVLDQLESGAMPPKKKPRPPAEEVRAVSDLIRKQLASAEEERRARDGRVVLRRLNRVEYENTIRDLLGVDTSLRDLLPEDGAAHGFDNVGVALQTSSFLIERYLEGAEKALADAVSNRPRPRTIKKRNTVLDTHRFKSATEPVYRRLPGETVALFSSSHWNAVDLTTLWPQDRGRYRFRISAYAIQSNGKPVTFRVMNGDGGMGGAKAHLVGYFDAPPDQATVFEFIDLVEPRTSGSILPYGIATAHVLNKIGAETYDGPGLAVEWMEVEGPLHEAWPPPSHRNLFGDLPQALAPIHNQPDRVEVVSAEPLEDADRILRKFLRRAFRRPVTDRDLAPYLALVQARLNGEQSFEQAVRVALVAAMTAPDFLFLRESPGRLDDFAIASRLSYFLWSSMPDEELLSVAERGELHEPKALRAQVERLLADPKASAFTRNFVGQWLGLRDIDFTEPSHILYPEFDEMLKVSMVRETELFFQEVLGHDLSLANFIHSDFTMLNGRLAKHYGIPGVEGWEFQKTRLPAGSHRGGVLTMASVLKVTANGTTTSPVTRGVWLLERILGTPPRRPPEDVAALDPDTRGATTIRQQLAKHRQLESCAACHRKIDPPGFALESFDVIGGWRNHYRTSGIGTTVTIDGRKMPYLHGTAVDPSDRLPDGRAFQNIDEFKLLLLEEKEQIARALTAKLLTYATGGAPENIDDRRIGAIVAAVREKDYGFRSLVHEVVQSELFKEK